MQKWTTMFDSFIVGFIALIDFIDTHNKGLPDSECLVICPIDDRIDWYHDIIWLFPVDFV